jgi:hypothetical protein
MGIGNGYDMLSSSMNLNEIYSHWDTDRNKWEKM